MMRRTLTLLFLFLSLLSMPVFAQTDGSIGEVVFAIGKVTAVDDKGGERRLRKQSAVFEGDTITTSARGQLQIRMIDDAFVSIKPDSVFRVDGYVLDTDNKDNNRSDVSLIKGGFRAITGSIGKVNREGYRVSTPVATMGIRGTDYVIQLCQSSDCGGSLNPVKRLFGGGKPSLYVGVIKGGVSLLNNAGVLNLEPSQYAVIADVNIPPLKLKHAPRFLMFDRLKMDPVVEKQLREDDEKAETEKRVASETGTSGQTPSSSPGSSPSAANTVANAAQNPVDRAAESGVFDGLRDRASGLKSSVSRRFDSTVDLSRLSDFNAARTLTSVESTLSSSNVFTGLTELVGSGVGETDFQFSSPVNGPSPGTLPDSRTPIQTTSKSGRTIAITSNTLLTDIGKPVVATGAVEATGITDGALTSFYADFVSNPDAKVQNAFYSLGSAVQDSLGYDPATGLMWGRWANGTVSVNDLENTKSVALGEQGIHWVMGAPNSATFTLPSTGTAQYELIGNTDPRDSLGNRGLLGAATLNADFATRTVDASVDVSINNQLWQGSQTGMRLSGDANFLGNLNVNVTPNGGSAVNGTGSIAGSLSGPLNSAGVPNGAGITYQMNATPGGVNTSVSGAAALQAK